MKIFNSHRQMRIHRQGVTLIELLISMVISVIVLLALSGVYISAKQSLKFQDTTGRMQEDAAYALEVMTRDVRMAGYAGCRGIDVLTVAGVPIYYPASMVDSMITNLKTASNPLASLSSLSADMSVTVQPLAPHNFLRGFDTLDIGLLPAAVTTDANSHALFFSNVSANSVATTSNTVASIDSLPIGADTYSWGSTARYYVVSDCYKSHTFLGQVGTIAGVSVISHDLVAGNTAASFSGNATYTAGATVAPLEWRYYFIAERTSAASSTPKSLYRKRFDGVSSLASEEVIANVEGLRFHYAENTGNDANGFPTYTADIWRTSAATVTDWSRVVAIRIGLMMIAPEDAADVESATTPTFSLLGSSYSVPTGASANRIRKEFSTTVVLRNRVPVRY